MSSSSRTPISNTIPRIMRSCSNRFRRGSPGAPLGASSPVLGRTRITNTNRESSAPRSSTYLTRLIPDLNTLSKFSTHFLSARAVRPQLFHVIPQRFFERILRHVAEFGFGYAEIEGRTLARAFGVGPGDFHRDVWRQFLYDPRQVFGAGDDAAAGVVGSLFCILRRAGQINRQGNVLGIDDFIGRVDFGVDGEGIALDRGQREVAHDHADGGAADVVAAAEHAGRPEG